MNVFRTCCEPVVSKFSTKQVCVPFKNSNVIASCTNLFLVKKVLATGLHHIRDSLSNDM